MSSTGYLVRLIFHRDFFLEFLGFIQAHNVATKYCILCSKEGKSVNITTDSGYFHLQKQSFTLESDTLEITIPDSLSGHWHTTFGFTLNLRLPLDHVFERYLLSDPYLSRSWQMDDPYRPELMSDGFARIGYLVVRARGLDAIKPDFVEVELNPIVNQVFLQESSEWNRWLLSLGQATQAFLLYIHEDYSSSKILWHRNKSVTLTVQNFDDLPDAASAFAASKTLVSTFPIY